MRKRTSFSRSLKDTEHHKSDNHPAAFKAKVAIRRNVLAAIGRDQAAVFDAYAGSGALYRAVWSDAERYVGCDLKWYRDERLAYVADCRRVLRAVDLKPWSIFDLDSYGSPWEAALIVAARRPVEAGERIGIVLTEGSGLKVKLGTLPTALSIASGVNAHLLGGARVFDRIIERAIAGLGRRMTCRIVKRWEAQGKTGAGVRYIGLVLEGISTNEAGASSERA